MWRRKKITFNIDLNTLTALYIENPLVVNVFVFNEGRTVW
jgi:hypothetical protein